MATQITANLPTLNFPREVDYPTQEDWAAFSAAAELNFGILGGSWSTQMQNWKDQANAMSIESNNNADIAQAVANYQGDWVSQGYTLGQSVSVSGVYYICKLTHITGQNPTTGGSLYWNLALGNWNLKVNNYGNETIAGVKTFSSNIVGSITGNSATATKLATARTINGVSFDGSANITVSDATAVKLTGNQTIAGIKTFSSSPIVPTPTTTGNVITMDYILQSTASVIGYTNGSGSSVNQLTNKNTNVLCPTPTGTILTDSSSLSAGATAQFTVSCSHCTEHSTVQANCKYTGGVGLNYDINTVSNNGGFIIQIKNKTASSLSEHVYITYTILKGIPS